MLFHQNMQQSYKVCVLEVKLDKSNIKQEQFSKISILTVLEKIIHVLKNQ